MGREYPVKIEQQQMKGTLRSLSRQIPPKALSCPKTTRQMLTHAHKADVLNLHQGETGMVLARGRAGGGELLFGHWYSS